MANGPIDSFQIGISWNANPTEQKQFFGAIQTAATKARLLSDAIENMAGRIAASMENLGKDSRALISLSELTGVSIDNIEGLDAAFTQVGGSGEEINGVLLAAAQSIRETNGATAPYFAKFGLFFDKITGKATINLRKAQTYLKSLDPTQLEAFLKNANMSSSTGQYILKSGDLMQDQIEADTKRRRAAGVDDKTEQQNKDLDDARMRIKRDMALEWQKIVSILEGPLTGRLVELDKWMQDHEKPFNDWFQGQIDNLSHFWDGPTGVTVPMEKPVAKLTLPGFSIGIAPPPWLTALRTGHWPTGHEDAPLPAAPVPHYALGTSNVGGLDEQTAVKIGIGGSPVQSGNPLPISIESLGASLGLGGTGTMASLGLGSTAGSPSAGPSGGAGDMPNVNPGSAKAITGNQAALAKESYDYWRSQGLSHEAALASVGNERGENPFGSLARGDGGSAYGSFQWHMDRVRDIYKNTGIDVRTASHLDQLKAARWEAEKGANGGHIWKDLLTATKRKDAVWAWVHRFERSAAQASDLAVRTGYANAAENVVGSGALKPPPVYGAAATHPAPMVDARSFTINVHNVDHPEDVAAAVSGAIKPHVAKEGFHAPARPGAPARPQPSRHAVAV